MFSYFTAHTQQSAVPLGVAEHNVTVARAFTKLMGAFVTFWDNDAGSKMANPGGQNSDVLDLEVGAQRGSRRVRPGVLGPQRSCGVRELDLYHQVQLRRQHLPAAQDAHHGGAQQHVRVAALCGASESCSPCQSPPRPCSGCTRGPSAGHARPRCGRSS